MGLCHGGYEEFDRVQRGNSRGQRADPGSSGKMAVQWCVECYACMCVLFGVMTRVRVNEAAVL